MDCQFQLLNSNEVGSVSLCRSCNKYIIEIGTIVLKFESSCTKVFLNSLQKAKQQYFNCSEMEAPQKVYLKTPIDNMMIGLSQKEMNESILLIEFALLKSEVDALLVKEF